MIKMKKYLLLLMFSAMAFAQNPTRFPYGVQITGGQPDNTTPAYLTTTSMTGLQEKIPSAYIEKTANKQDNLNYDGTSTKYPSVDGVNDWTRKMAKVATKTGLLSKFDSFDLIPLTTTTLRIAAVSEAMFWNDLFISSTSPSAAIKSFAQKDYDLTQLITATGGNVNVNPLTSDGKYVRYIGYDKNGNVYSSLNSFSTNNDVLQLGFVTVLKTGSSVVFLDGITAGARNVFAQPNLASNTDFDKVTSTSTSITVGRKSDASFSTSTGTITGISINWKGLANPSNGSPIDVVNYAGATTATFAVIDPTFLTSTASISPHTLITESDGGITINQSFYNTTTGLRGTMANGSAAVARILIGLRGGIYWQMGEFATTACYSDLATAKSNIYSHQFSDAILPPGVAFEIARIAFVKSATVTNNDSQFYVVNTGGGGSGSTSAIPPVSDATTATKGIIKLSGDLGGTADSPTVPGLALKQNVITNPVTGTGILNYVPKWNSANSISNSIVYDNGISVGIDTVIPYGKFSVNGTTSLITNDWSAGTNGTAMYGSLGSITGNTYGAIQVANNGDNGSVGNLVLQRFGGNVLIGTTTDNGVDKLQVSGTINASPATTSTQVVVKSQLDGVKPYKVYSAIVNQISTSAPTLNVYQNDIGAIVWSRAGAGVYFGTLTGAFSSGKVLGFVTTNSGDMAMGVTKIDSDTVVLYNRTLAGTATDSITDASLKIEVYP